MVWEPSDLAFIGCSARRAHGTREGSSPGKRRAVLSELDAPRQ